MFERPNDGTRAKASDLKNRANIVRIDHMLLCTNSWEAASVIVILIGVCMIVIGDL